MKNRPVDPFAADDIRRQMERIHRGLGNPEPPIVLSEVRELLKLDLKFYSGTNTGALAELGSKIKVGAKQLLLRPSLIVDVVRKAGLKALWIPDRKRILIDSDLPDLKKRHAESHEITHSVTPHHRLYLLGDDTETLRQSCYETLEAEANFGSGQLLFPHQRFREEALDVPRTISEVRRLAKDFGNTITMTLWRLIEEARADERLLGVVSVHPKRLSADFNPNEPCRYFIESPGFRAQFGNVTEAEVFARVQAYSSWAQGGPLGEGDIFLTDRNGDRHVFHLATFYNGHEALTLGSHIRRAPRHVVVA